MVVAETDGAAPLQAGRLLAKACAARYHVRGSECVRRGAVRFFVRMRATSFEVSARLARYAAIAQLVEHVIRNDGVGGSIPSRGTIFSIA